MPARVVSPIERARAAGMPSRSSCSASSPAQARKVSRATSIRPSSAPESMATPATTQPVVPRELSTT